LLSSINRHPEAQAEFRAAIRLDPGNMAQQDLAEMKRPIGGLRRAGNHPAAAFGRQEGGRKRSAQGRQVTTSPAVLLRSPRARPLRRFLAGFIDIYMIPMLSACLFLYSYRYWGVVMGTALYAYNGYREGKTGQSFGKALTGLRTIHGKTGKYIGGGKGILRRVLLVVDYFTVAGFLMGLITGQTCADMFMGTVVVWRPTWVTAKKKRETAALERSNYRRLRRRTGIIIYLIACIIPKLQACGHCHFDTPWLSARAVGRHKPYLHTRLRLVTANSVLGQACLVK
jgi:uncharacterized RDD family membrane protein YckC